MTSDLYDEEREPVFIQADLSTAAGCTKVVNDVTSCFGGIDILVSVVGASSAPSRGFAVLSDEEWQKELNINLMAAVRLDRGLLPAMLKQGSGVIIHISSIQRRLPLYEAISFVIGLIISTIIIFIVTKLFGEKGVKTAFITAIIGAIIYSIAYFLLGNGVLAAIVGGIAWLLSLKWLYKMGWIKSIIITVIIWIIASIVGILLPTAPGPL